MKQKDIEIFGTAAITFALFGCTALTGMVVFLGPAFLVGLVSLALILREDEKKGIAYERFKARLIVVGIIVFFTLLVLTLFPVSSFTVNERTEYPIYDITAPFGQIYRNTDGTLVFIFGSLSTSTVEVYRMKYLDGDALRTETFDAENTALYVTGNFSYVHVQPVTHTINLWGVEMVGHGGQADYWRIEIPRLPDVDGLTENYTVIP